MSARDRFSVTLECPQCGKSGSAEASEEDGWSYKGIQDQSRTYSSVPEGFERAEGSWSKILCQACQCEAIAK